MDIHPVFVGIDVSKAWLDIYDGRPRRCANTEAAVGPLARRWADEGAFVVLEATGAYDRLLRGELERAGVAFARVNPAKARDFARAAGFLAKTDRIDARMLSLMGQRLRPRPAEPVDPAREELAFLHRRRDQLVHARQQERTRRKGAGAARTAASLERHLAWLDAEIAVLDGEIAAAIAATPALARARRLLGSVPGIGPVAATTLLALAPELGTRSAKAVAALAGLAPLNRDSGQMRGRRTVGGGRKRIRDALYMAAVAASRSHSRFSERYRHLLKAGKPPKLALIALARAILVTANAVLRDQRAFQP